MHVILSGNVKTKLHANICTILIDERMQVAQIFLHNLHFSLA